MCKATQRFDQSKLCQIYGKLDQNLQRKKCSTATFEINMANEQKNPFK